MRRNKSLNGEKIMNVFRYMVVSIFACCALECLQAANEIPPRAKKHYLDEGMISVTKEGISIRTEEGFVGARAIRSDKHGIFVYESDMTNVGNVCEKKFTHVTVEIQVADTIIIFSMQQNGGSIVRLTVRMKLLRPTVAVQDNEDDK